MRMLLVTPLLGMTVAILAVRAHAEGKGVYFPETGHRLAPDFEDIFESLGGIDVLGFPLTEPFVDPSTGRTVQYLENVRLEADPTVPESARLGALGEILGGWSAPVRELPFASEAQSGCQYFDKSGHYVCGAFLDFLQIHGGPAALGYPISEYRSEAGRIIQYLQRVRLDWYPELGGRGQVRLGPLGSKHFAITGYDKALLDPALPDNPDLYQALELSLLASVRDPLIHSGQSQLVFLVVRDQNGFPLSGAATTLVLRSADQERTLVMPLTDSEGVTRLALESGNALPGDTIFLEYQVVRGDLRAIARDSYQIAR